jgi:hypothetical protein
LSSSIWTFGHVKLKKEKIMNNLKEKKDKERIIAGEPWVECYICREIFKRKRETARYCNICGHGFCEGEHGTFEGGRFGLCVRCYSGI